MTPASAQSDRRTREAWHSWLDHPTVAAHYRERGLIDGLPWEQWTAAQLGGAAKRSLQLGCGAGDRSLFLFEKGLSRWIDGIDASDELVTIGETRRDLCDAPGSFRVGDINSQTLRPRTYDLIFATHVLQQAMDLDAVLGQVYEALTPNGLFVVEGFAGPNRFQWTDVQISLVRALIGMAPDRLRTFRWGAVKPFEGRPDPAAVAAATPFDAIRSAEIVTQFARTFEVVASRRLGGTLQQLFYNGIVHNFSQQDPEAMRLTEGMFAIEDALIDARVLSSDFMLLIGRRR